MWVQSHVVGLAAVILCSPFAVHVVLVEEPLKGCSGAWREESWGKSCPKFRPLVRFERSVMLGSAAQLMTVQFVS